jgi:hypothetical protein
MKVGGLASPRIRQARQTKTQTASQRVVGSGIDAEIAGGPVKLRCHLRKSPPSVSRRHLHRQCRFPYRHNLAAKSQGPRHQLSHCDQSRQAGCVDKVAESTKGPSGTSFGCNCKAVLESGCLRTSLNSRFTSGTPLPV